MKKAGFSSGKCEGDCDDHAWSATTRRPASDTAEVVKDELTQLGFNVNLQPVDHDVMYTKFCDVPKNQPNVCPNVGWCKDFNDAQSMLDPVQRRRRSCPSNNSNWPLLDDQGDQQGDGQGDARSPTRPSGPRHTARSTTRSRRWRRRSRGSGTTRPTSGSSERGRRDQPVQRELGHVVHVAREVRPAGEAA